MNRIIFVVMACLYLAGCKESNQTTGTLLSSVQPLATVANGVFGLNSNVSIANGQLCGAAANCQSGYCYAVPGQGNYCLAREMNCPKPGADGVLFGESYTFQNQEYSCNAGTGLVSVGAPTPTPMSGGFANGHSLHNRLAPLVARDCSLQAERGKLFGDSTRSHRRGACSRPTRP